MALFNVNSPRGAVQSLTYYWSVAQLEWLEGTQPSAGAGGGGDASAANQTTEIARLTSILGQFDVALSTRTKPADQQHTIVDSSALPSGAATAVLQTQPGVDIGDVTVNNAAGASAVNVQDGGNSLTIDNANLDAAISTRLKPADTLTAVTTVGTITNTVHVDDNAGSLTIDNANLDVALSTRLKPADTLAAVTTVGTITNVVHVDDNAGSLTVDNTNLDVALSTRLKPADTLTGVTTVGTITNVVHIDDNAGSVTVDSTQLPAALVAGRLDENVGAWLGSTAPTVGQKAMASSVPVVLASDQASIPVTVSGVATAGNQATEIASLASIDTKLTSPLTVQGGKTHNNAAPGATNVGVLPAVATAAAPSFTEGNQVGLSTDLAGSLRISGSISAATSADVQDADDDAGYVDGQTGKNLVQTPDGRLRVLIAGIVQDAVSSYTEGQTKALSLSGDGRLRVVTASESVNFTGWGDSESWGSDDSFGSGEFPLTVW